MYKGQRNLTVSFTYGKKKKILQHCALSHTIILHYHIVWTIRITACKQSPLFQLQLCLLRAHKYEVEANFSQVQVVRVFCFPLKPAVLCFNNRAFLQEGWREGKGREGRRPPFSPAPGPPRRHGEGAGLRADRQEARPMGRAGRARLALWLAVGWAAAAGRGSIRVCHSRVTALRQVPARPWGRGGRGEVPKLLDRRTAEGRN